VQPAPSVSLCVVATPFWGWNRARMRPQFENTRYNRQELMPQVGLEGQARLSKASVAVIGAGGVKSPLLLYLAAAGIGRISVIDFDVVELSNLNRQILFTGSDIGQPKAVAAVRRLKDLNSSIAIEAITERVTAVNAPRLLNDFDIVVEGGDSLAGRLLINRYCLNSGQPMVHASAQFNYGYVLSMLANQTACFECVFPDLPPGHGGSVPVMGVATGLAGVLGAGEVMKLVLGHGRPFVNGIMTFSAFVGDFTFIPIPRRIDCPACGAATHTKAGSENMDEDGSVRT
jgi:molybdopterin/thiamine biosynthesis adenylyltransferase